MGSVPRRRLGVLLALLAAPVATGAQDLGFAEKIRPGQTVIVRDVKGADTRGVVQSVDSGTLVVKYGLGRFPDPTDPARMLNDTRAFTPADVVRVQRPAPIWDGAVKGALVGLIPLGLFAGACDCGAPTGGAYVVFLGVPAAIGLGIDAAWGPKTVYGAPVSRGAVSIVPVLTRDRRGIAASIRF